MIRESSGCRSGSTARPSLDSQATVACGQSRGPPKVPTLNAKRFPTTHPYYIYHVQFSDDVQLPRFQHKEWFVELPHSSREVWVKLRRTRNALLALDPKAKVDVHEARRCPRCHLLQLGIGAQMIRHRETVARAKGVPVGKCGTVCV